MNYAFLEYNPPEPNLNVHDYIHNYYIFVMRKKLSDINGVCDLSGLKIL